METDIFPDEAATIISQDNNSSSSSTSIIETTAMRQRLNTEETFRIHNHDEMPRNANPFDEYQQISHNQQQQQEGRLFYRREEDNLDLSINNDVDVYPSLQFPATGLRTMNEEDDGDSLVSALTAEEEEFSKSNSDRKQQLISRFFRGGSGGDEVLPSPPPPIEVTTTTPRNTSKSLSNPSTNTANKMEDLIADLVSRRSFTTASHYNHPSPQIPRPEIINRTVSCPTRPTIPENSPIVINGIALNSIKHRNDNGDHNDVDDNDTNDIIPEIVGGRKRRVHRRVKSGAEVSVGSLVGQSTLLTESTVAGSSFTGGASSSCCYSAEDTTDASVRRTIQNFRQVSTVENLLMSATGAEDGIGCCSRTQQQRSKRKELKYVVKKVTAPIRMIPLFKEKKAKLKRSTTGSLV